MLCLDQFQCWRAEIRLVVKSENAGAGNGGYSPNSRAMLVCHVQCIFILNNSVTVKPTGAQ